MDDVVYDVSYELGGTSLTARGRTAREAIVLVQRYPFATVRDRKLLPCAQRPSARIATLPPAGTTPANPAGGGDL